MIVENRFLGLPSLPVEMINDIEVIAVGSERCVNALPEVEQLGQIIKQVHDLGKSVRLVTPKVPQEHFDKVKKLIENAVIMGIDSITVNDYGIMFACRNDWIGKEIDIALGRGVSWCMEECSWHNNLLREESEFVKNTCLMSNMENQRKLSFLKTFGINEIEIEGMPGVLSNLNILRKNMKLIIHIDYPVISFSRACHTKKFLKCDFNECTLHCKDVIKLNMKERYEGSIPYPHLEEIDDDLRSIIGNIFISGNLVLASKVCLEEIKNLIEDTDTIVINHLYDENGNGMEELIKEVVKCST